MPNSKNPVNQRSGASTNIILTVIVLVFAVGVLGVVLWFGGQNKPQAANPGQEQPPAVVSPPGSNTLSTAPDKKVTLTEFVDFQCPQCHKIYEMLTKDLEQKYQGKITFVTRNYPLPMHPLAQSAARSSEAAAAQGKYQQMYHALNEHWGEWAAQPDQQTPKTDPAQAQQQFDRYAQEIGLDLNRYHQDLNSPQVTEKINKDKADGDKAGVQGTPSFFINGRQIQLSSVQQMYQEIDGQLAR